VKISVTGRHMDVTDILKKFVVEKVQHLTRFFENIQRSEVIFCPEREGQFSAELILHAPRHSVLVIHTKDKTATAAFDSAISRMERQLGKLKDKLRGKTTKIQRNLKKIRAAAGRETEAAVSDSFGDLWW
jgi:putative sigma-54 modulation protein